MQKPTTLSKYAEGIREGIRHDLNINFGATSVRAAEFFIEEMFGRGATMEQFASALKLAADPRADDSDVALAFRVWVDLNCTDLAADLDRIENSLIGGPVTFTKRAK